MPSQADPAPPVDALAAAHARIVAEGAIQFELPAYKAAAPPSWIDPLLRMLAESGPVLRVVFWAGVAIIAFLIARLVWGELRRLRLRRAREREADPLWRPDAADARALLDEADRHAAAGRYAQAAHLILLRSVDQIAARRPGEVRPSLTSRDIAGGVPLPGDVRGAFTLIAGIVEASLFGGGDVGVEAWARARAAYEAVAFPSAWAARA